MSRDRAFKLRFEILAEDHDRLRAIFFASHPADIEKSRMLSVYLDTPDAALHEQDLRWCFSRKDKFRDGRLKAGEWRLDSESDARSFVKKNRLRDRIGGAFTMRVDREFILHRCAQSWIEISLERTSLRSGDQSAVTAEVQFTLREGEAEELVRLVSEVLPQAVPVSDSQSYMERGYRLFGAGMPEPSGGEAATLSKDMSVVEAFRLIARAEIERALAEPPPLDQPSLQQNIRAVRRVQSAFRFFASAFDGEAPLPDLRSFGQWEAALEKADDLETVVTVYLKPAALRGRWEGVLGLVARIDESRTRAHVILAQIWPAARVKNLFSTALDWLDAYVPSSAASAAPLSVFVARELAKAVDEVQAIGAILERTGMGKATAGDLRPLSEAVARLHAVVVFFKPLAGGKAAAKRWSALQEAIGGLKGLLDKEYHLSTAQTLVADAASHIARLKQTKTQVAQLYAAGALAGFVEALKEEGPEKALRAALANLSDVKPFWAKIE